MATTPAGPSSATTFGERYAIERELGRGGMATVYLARDLRHDRRVALKVLRPELASSLGAERFLREVRIVGGLMHPHILTLHDSGAEGESLFYVMPYVEGETVRDRLTRDGALPVAEALRLTSEAADALDYAHQRGIVHRDVKPENVLVTSGHAVLTDFGVAHAIREAGGERLTATGLSLGTPAYMSPEQAAGDRAVDGRSDVFSLGVLLYEMLTAQSPFSGGSVAATLTRVLTADPRPLREVRPDAPPQLDAVLARALAKDPDARFPTARALADALAPLVATLSIGAASIGRTRRWRRGTRVAAALTIAAAVVAAALLARGTASAVEPPSIAVLPFVNETGDTANTYFGAGIADELLTALTDVPGLRVASRTSSFSLASNPDTRVAARRLGVNAVLEGSVRRAGGMLRVTATLFDAARDSTLWTKRFDRPVADVFQVQEDIARLIVKDLRVHLAAGQTTVVRRRTGNADAHDLVLRAKARFAEDRREGSFAALDLLRQAEALDSSYAEIHALRSRVYQSLAIFRDQGRLPGEEGVSPGEMLRRARASAARAVKLDSMSAAAHLELGNEIFRYDWDWAAAEREIRRARALNGANSDVFRTYSRFLRSMGRFDEARAMLDTATRLESDPGAASRRGEGLGRISYFAGEFDRAVRETESDRRPQSRTRVAFYAEALIEAKRYAQAESLLIHAEPDGGTEDPSTLALLYARSGRMAQARAALARYRQSPVFAPTLAAGILATLGDTDEAIAEIEKAIATRDPLVVDLKTDPRLAPLRRDPRLQRIVASLRFPR